VARAIPESRRQIDSWGALLPLSRFGGDDESEAHFHRGKTQNLFRDAVNFEYFRSTRRRMLLRRIRPAIPVGVNCPPWRRPRCEILGRSCKSRAAALAGGPQVRYPGWMSSTTKPPANLLSVIPGEYVSAALRTLPDRVQRLASWLRQRSMCPVWAGCASRAGSCLPGKERAHAGSGPQSTLCRSSDQSCFGQLALRT